MSSKKILIIDDDVTSLDIVDFLFEEKGFAVERSADGFTALEAVTKSIPDVILIDLMMPRMNGQECIRKLREQGITAPIVAFTAVDDPDIHEEALEAGCNRVLTKPCRPQELLKEVNALLV